MRESLAVKHLRVVVESTLAYMSPEELKGVLIDPVWLACDNLPASYSELLGVLRAAAMRNDVMLEELAGKWFESNGGRSEVYKEEFDKIIFGLWQLALIKLERPADAKQLETLYGRSVEATGYYGFIRSLLLAWLDVGDFYYNGSLR